MINDTAFLTPFGRGYHLFKRLNEFLVFLCVSGILVSSINYKYDLFSASYMWLFAVGVHIFLRIDYPNHDVSADLRIFTFFRFNAMGMWKMPMIKFILTSKVITNYIFRITFMKNRSNILRDNPKWAFQIPGLCQIWNAENSCDPKFILA